ncbi:MAG: hypothetical protein N3A72_01850 [bacterium]|nr:hypothetical protein [bacterium]
MKLMKYICIVVLVCICASFGFAKKYSDPPAGQGTSTIGIGGDYASLFECAQDFNTTANTGSWTVTILNDLYEPKNVAFGNWVLDASTILFKPAKPLTISFTTTLDNAGISGAWVIGLQELDMLYGAMDSTAISTNNFIIDGSTTAGGTDRSLTVVNSPDLVAGAFPVILAVYGACTNVQVRNCNLINAAVLPTGTHYVVNVRGRQPTMPLLYYSTTSSLAPKDFLLENCYVMSTGTPGGAGGSVCYAIQLGIHGGGAYANKPTGCTIKNCLIEARARGIHVNFHDNVTISNNTIRVRQTLTSAATPIGIAINDVAGNGIVTIANNVIDKVESSSQTGSVTTGPTGIDLSSSASPTALEAYVYNNMISGLKYVNPVTTTPQNAGIRGIVAFNAAHASSKYHIMYNSISIDSQENLGITVSSNSCFGIGLIKTAPTGARTIKNNIVRMAQPGGHCIILGNATTASNLYGYDYNNYINLNGANLGRLGSTNYTTLAAWTTALAAAGNLTGDQNSQSIDPLTTAPGSWISTTNLRFVGGSAFPLRAGTTNLTPSPISVTTDIDGQTRHSSTPWPGCDEQYIGSTNVQPVPVELSRFETETY